MMLLSRRPEHFVHVGVWHGAQFTHEAPQSDGHDSERKPLICIIRRGDVSASENRPTSTPMQRTSWLTQSGFAAFQVFLRLLSVDLIGSEELAQVEGVGVPLLLRLADGGFGDGGAIARSRCDTRFGRRRLVDGYGLPVNAATDGRSGSRRY